MAPKTPSESEREVWGRAKTLTRPNKRSSWKIAKDLPTSFYMQLKELDMLSRLRGIFGFMLVLHWVRLD